MVTSKAPSGGSCAPCRSRLCAGVRLADIFISYSQTDRQTARELAGFLESCGYDVWWDYDLVGGIQFQKQIKEQLAKARAAIVVWTPRSVESEWVIDEAEEAKHAKKLLPVRTPDLDFKAIPLGFRQLQTDPVDKPDRILKSLDELGIKPSNPPAAPSAAPISIGGQTVDPATLAQAEQFANWEFIKNSSMPADFRAYIQRFPESPLSELARTRLRDMARAAIQAIGVYDRTPASGESTLPVEVQELQAFVSDFPDDENVGVARRRLYSLESRALESLDRSSEAALIEHLRLFPDSMTSAEVRARLADLKHREEDEAVWRALKLHPTRHGIEDYLKRFPLGAHAEEARKLLAPVVLAEKRASKWAMIKEQGFSDQLKAFIAEFGEGPEVEEARIKLAARLKQKEDEAWVKVKDARHPAPLLQFIRDYPAGAREHDALRSLEALPQRADDEAWAIVKAGNTPQLYRAYLGAVPAGAHRAAAMEALGLGAAAAGQAKPAATEISGKSTAQSGATPLWKKLAVAIAVLGTLASGLFGLVSAYSLSLYESSVHRERVIAFSLAFGIFLLLSALGMGWRRMTDAATDDAAAEHAKVLAILLLPLAAVFAAGTIFSSNPLWLLATMPSATSIATALALVLASVLLYGAARLPKRWRHLRTVSMLSVGLGAAAVVPASLSYAGYSVTDFHYSEYLHYLSIAASGGAAVAIVALLPALARLRSRRAYSMHQGQTAARP